MTDPNEKKFKIKIRLRATLDENENPTPPAEKDLNEAVQEWWNEGKGKEHLLNYLNDTIVNVKYNSYLRNFTSHEDSVDKEAYD